MNNFLRSFCHRPNAFRAQQLVHFASIDHDHYPLQIRFKSAVGCPQGKAAIVTKSCRLSTGFTLSHFQFSPFVL